MLREKFAEIMVEAITQGYSRGIDVFMEHLEEDLAKGEVFEENSMEDMVDYMMQENGWVTINEDGDQIDY